MVYLITDRFAVIKNYLVGKILHVGCAVGPIHELLLKKYGNNVVGIDIMKIRQKNLIIADAQTMPFKDCSFDSIFAGELIEHLHEPEKFLLECKRVLRGGGTLIITTPNKKSLINRIFHSYEKEAHLSLFSLKEIKDLLKKHNFSIVFVEMLPYTEESNYGSRHKELFLLRKLIHHFLPFSLRENIVIVGKKVQ